MDLKKKLNVEKLKESVEEGAKSAKESISNINVESALKGAKVAIETTKDKIDVNELAHSAKDKALEGKAKVESAVDSIFHKTPEEEIDFSRRKLISLLLLLVGSDGVVTDEERQLLITLAANFDENSEEYIQELECECMAGLEVSAKEFGSDNAAKVEAQRIVESLELDPQEAKLLCWNLLALGNSGTMSNIELDFIRFVSEKSGVDKAVFEELCAYNNAYLELDNAIAELKSSNRSYAEIEPLVNEGEKRAQNILEAAQALIADR